MTDHLSRRDALKRLGALGALGTGALRGVLRAPDLVVAGQPVELAVYSLGGPTVRLTLRPLANGAPEAIPTTGALVQESLGREVKRTREAAGLAHVRAGDLVVRLTDG